VRQPPISTFNEAPWGTLGNGAGGLVFAKRKKNLFKGPMLNTSSPTPAGGANHTRTGSHSRSASVAGRRSGEITGIEEEDEDEIEEVDAFSPITGPGEIEETIYPAMESPSEKETMRLSGNQ
jgi:hypothetical protein